MKDERYKTVQCPVCKRDYIYYEGSHNARLINERGMCVDCYGRCPYCEDSRGD